MRRMIEYMCNKLVKQILCKMLYRLGAAGGREVLGLFRFPFVIHWILEDDRMVINKKMSHAFSL